MILAFLKRSNILLAICSRIVELLLSVVISCGVSPILLSVYISYITFVLFFFFPQQCPAEISTTCSNGKMFMKDSCSCQCINMCDGDNMKRNDETCKCECDNQHQCTTPFVLLKNSPTSCGCGCSEESVKYVAGLGETFSLSSSCKAECIRY